MISSRSSWIACGCTAMALFLAVPGCGSGTQETTPTGATVTPELEVDESQDPDFSSRKSRPQPR